MMLVQRFRDYFRPIARHQRNAAVDFNLLSDRLEQASCHVAYCERLITGWRELITTEEAAGFDVSAARALLEQFQVDLEMAMADKRQAENTQAKMLLDL